MNDQPTTTTDWQARAEKAEAELRLCRDVLFQAECAFQNESGADETRTMFAVRRLIDQLDAGFPKTGSQLDALKAACAAKDEALRKYQAALKDLGELSKNHITYFEESPSRDVECAQRWFALKDAVQAGKDALDYAAQTPTKP